MAPTRWRWLLALLALAPTAGARGDEFYYLLVFGSQHSPPRIRYSHTFATFVKATGQGPCASAYALEVHTISWFPASLEIRPAALLPECGGNFDLETSLRVALDTCQAVSMWGPYQIDCDLYVRALEQIAHLESGEVRYKAIDSGFRASRVSNCIHAVSDLAGGWRLRVFSPGFGETASGHIAQSLRPWIIDSNCRHDWVAARLGLDAYPLLRRDLGPPR